MAGSKKKKTRSKKRPSRKRSGSNQKMTWEQFLQNKDSKKVLQDSWKHKNPQQHFGKAIKKLHQKYSSIKKK